MLLAAQAAADDTLRIALIAGVLVLAIIGLIIFLVFMRYFRLWIQSKTTGASIGIWDLVGMTFR